MKKVIQPPVPAVGKRTDAEKIKLAKQAYAKYLHTIHDISVEQKTLLDAELKKIEQMKIDQLRAYIQTM